MIYCLYIFHRQYCVFYCDWNRTRKPSSNNAYKEEQKLLSGLLFSLKSFSQKLDPQSPSKGQVSAGCNAFNSYITPLYKLHYFETPTGYKFVMMTDPTVPEMKEDLRKIYSDLFVDMVVKNAEYEIGSAIHSQPFDEAVTSFVSKIDYFSSRR